MSASAFRDSAPDLSDTPLLRERMRHEGYLFVRDLLPADELAVLSMPLLAIARAGDWVQKDTPLTQASADHDGFCVEPTPEYVSAYRHMYALPESRTLKH